MKFARCLLIFSYGLFTIAAQSLLFREFVTTFEGNDISVGFFFASWFLWVSLGAIIVYKVPAVAKKLLKNVELLFLCYLPAFILQLILIIQARELASVQSYVLLPISTCLVLSIIVNAPVSIITGMLFPTVCRWLEKDHAVSGVYIIEAAGSFSGGLGVTVLLAFGVSPAKIFFVLAFIVSCSVFYVQLAKIRLCSRPLLKRAEKVKAHLVFIIVLCVAFCFYLQVDKGLMDYLRVVKWSKLLPASALRGSFQTAQSEYLYGVYRGQWLTVRQGSVIEAMPDESTAGQIAAIGLCQKPDATRVLVVGSGLGLCRQFTHLPQIETISWAHCDSEYVQKVAEFIPAELKIRDRRLNRVTGDVRELLTKTKKYYDIVIINLPDATSSVLNRYFTLQFYQLIKESLKPGGIIQVRIAGGENIMGTELVSLGASTKLTLEKVFSGLVLTPGEDTWFIASDSDSLTGRPGILRDRFAKIDNAKSVFAPEALLSVYLPDRADAALQSYANADLPEELLINRDSRLLTHLYSLLLAAKQSGAATTRLAKRLAVAGLSVFIVPILVFMLMRIVYILRTRPQGGISGFDSSFLVFSAGCVSIGMVIVLMYMYQTRFGSLYLYIGVISSLFMIGLTAGAALVRHLLTTARKNRTKVLLFVVMLIHSLVLYRIGFLSEGLTHLTFAIAFILCGLCAGGYFPIAAKQLANSGFETGMAAGKLETADHLGAAAGGLLTSLVLVPILGAKITLFVFILLIMANAAPAVLGIYRPGNLRSVGMAALRLRKVGYVLFGIAAAVILCSNLLVRAGMMLSSSLPENTAQALAGQLQIEKVSAITEQGSVNYFNVYRGKDELAGYIFSSDSLAPQVRGFGGNINLAVYVDSRGELINFNITRSNETPAYLEMLSYWQSTLNNRRLFTAGPFADVHAVTGATVSSKAILSALEISGCRFAEQVLEQSPQADKTKVPWAGYLPDSGGLYLITALVLTLIVVYRGGFWTRIAVLVFNLVAGGLVLNTQYSTEQIAGILSLHSPAAGFTGAFALLIGIPVVVMVFGNIYCGYMCPFGAAQELVGFIIPERFKYPLSAEKTKKAGFVKYVILFVLIIVFFVSTNRTTLAADPLIEIFNFRFSGYGLSMMLIVGAALAASLFYARFWCRYLCPAGAFLSLINNIAVFRRYQPAKKFGNCEFGITHKDKMQCIYCDRCRYQPKTTVEKTQPQAGGFAPAKLLNRCFLTVVLAVGIFVSTLSVNRFWQVMHTGFEQAAVLDPAAQMRDVDMERIDTMIRQKKLSDKEALFYKKVD